MTAKRTQAWTGRRFIGIVGRDIDQGAGNHPKDTNRSGQSKRFFMNFLTGLIPVVGQTVVPVLTAIFSGWVLSLELSGVPFERRGLRLVQRRQMLRRNRPLALGFGVATFVCFLIPLGAVLVMPAAVAGATLMTRRVYGLPTTAPQ